MRTPLKIINWDDIKKLADDNALKIEKTFMENGIKITRYETPVNFDHEWCKPSWNKGEEEDED